MATEYTFTARFAATLKPGTKVAHYMAGPGTCGLMLRVMPGGTKCWMQSIRINKKRCNLSIGRFPLVSFTEAKRRAMDNYRSARDGGDPRSRATQHAPAVPTVRTLAEAIMDQRQLAPLTRKDWWYNLNSHAAAILDKPVTAPTTRVAHDLLAPIWNTKPTIARKVHQRLKSVMDVAIARNYRDDNPFDGRVNAALGKQRIQTTHHAAVPHAEAAQAIASIRDGTCGHATTRLGVEFAILTACRAEEAAGCRWDEIDMDSQTWTIPAQRTKQRRDHRVPLSQQALDVLHRAASYKRTDAVFGVSAATLGTCVKSANVGGTLHGFRSTFRDWCRDTGVDRELAEAALAHVVGGVEGAYARSDMLERRRELMQGWADYLRRP